MRCPMCGGEAGACACRTGALPYRAAAAVAPVGESMRCLYCGGTRRSREAYCSICRAGPPSVLCSACGKTVFAPDERCACGATCRHWGAAAEGDLACPRCQGRLERITLGGDVHVEQCGRCLGCFVRLRDFSFALEHAGEHANSLAPFAFIPPDRQLPRQALLASVRCPHCRSETDRIRFAHRMQLVVDVCRQHGTWFDAGELLAVLSFVDLREKSGGVVPPTPEEVQETLRWDDVLARKRVEAALIAAACTRAEWEQSQRPVPEDFLDDD